MNDYRHCTVNQAADIKTPQALRLKVVLISSDASHHLEEINSTQIDLLTANKHTVKV